MTDSPGRHPDTPRTPPDAAPLSLADAAVRLGISPDAARKRLERGTLRGEKRNGRWQVSLEPDAAASTDPDAVPDTASDRDRTADAASSPNRTPPDAGVIVELRSLLAEERQRADRYLEAATLWQGRALQLEERLKALAAGPTAPDTGEPPITEAATRPQEAQAAPAPAAMQDTPRGLLARLRAIFSGP